jgi:hypothetical protein
MCGRCLRIGQSCTQKWQVRGITQARWTNLSRCRQGEATLRQGKRPPGGAQRAPTPQRRGRGKERRDGPNSGITLRISFLTHPLYQFLTTKLPRLGPISTKPFLGLGVILGFPVEARDEVPKRGLCATQKGGEAARRDVPHEAGSKPAGLHRDMEGHCTPELRVKPWPSPNPSLSAWFLTKRVFKRGGLMRCSGGFEACSVAER